ncbi:MAG: FAD-binding oxidoreductase [Thaumarchaeota archaeon]|nr:FAD-binding oxidoreductase [Nitrososphaerota archaeon]
MKADIEKGLSDANCERFDARKYSIDGLKPDSVLAPKDYESIASILKVANSKKIAVCFQGSGTKNSMGNIPSKLDAIILTKHFSKSLDYVPEDLTVSVQAGIKFKELQKMLVKKKQFIPLDLLFPEASIGGIISTNSTGPLRAGYGAVKNFLLGVKVAHADGRISRAGGKVVKNVAGYDLTKLYIGAMGTLGCILEANLKVYPLPEGESTLLVFVNAIDEIKQHMKKVLSAGISPVAFEFLNQETFRLLSKYIPKDVAEYSYCMALRFFGSYPSVTNQAREAEKLALGHKTEVLLRGESSGFWNSFLDKVSKNGATLFKISLPRDKIVDAIGKVEEAMPFYLPKTYGELSTGLLHFSLQRDLQLSDYPLLAKKLLELRLYFEKIGGNLTIEVAPYMLKEHFEAWGTVPPAFFLMKTLKQKFDPNSILSSGRFVGGL